MFCKTQKVITNHVSRVVVVEYICRRRKNRGVKIRGTAPSGFYRIGFLLACRGTGVRAERVPASSAVCVRHTMSIHSTMRLKKTANNSNTHNERDRFSATT